MRALVTGSAGFVGRHMVKALTARGYIVHGLDTARGPAEDARHLPCDFLRLRFWYDLVIHCAALVDGREAIEGKAALLGAYNLQLDGSLWEWALQARPGRVVYFSSSAVYPLRWQRLIKMDRGWRGLPLAEGLGSERDPDASYGWVKMMGERMADEVRKAGVPVTVVRPFSGYGEDQADCYPFPAMIARAKRRAAPFLVWGDGSQVRDFIHIDDVVAATLALVDAKADGPVNIGTGVGTSMDELARLAMAAVGYEAPIEHLADKPAGVAHRVAGTTLLHRYYTPQVSLSQGVRRAIEASA